MRVTTIGSRLRQLREKRGMTMEDVGKSTSISKQTLYKYEKGIITNIPSDKIESLARLYGVKPGYIMGWVDEACERLVTDAQTKEHLRVYLSLSKEDRSKVDEYAEMLAQKARDAAQDSASSAEGKSEYA